MNKIEQEPMMRILKKRPRGLGDVVHAAVLPFAAASDAIFKTDLKNCPGCHKRIDGLNKAVPFTKQKP